MHFVSVHTPYLAAEEKCNEVRVNDDDDDIDEDGDGGDDFDGDDFDGDIKMVFVLSQVGGYLADILDKAESDFVKSVLNVVNPKVKLKTIIIFKINFVISNKTILRMGPTTGLEVWMQIGTRDSSGFLEPRW